jgi:hypothetical protein
MTSRFSLSLVGRSLRNTIPPDSQPADPDGIAPPYHYETLHWYPGVKQMAARKEQWMRDHPNISATQGTEFAESPSPGPSSISS